jgi:CRP-like cAMP-binding protein
MLPSDAADIIATLKPRIFAGLAAKDVAAILERATECSFPAGALIAREGDPADRFFLLLRGRVRGFATAPDGDRLPMLWFSPGDIIGGAAMLFERAVYLLSSEAVMDSAMLAWERASMRVFATRYIPKLHENAEQIALGYLVVFRERYISAVGESADQRVAEALGTFARNIGQEVADGIELDISNEDLAAEAAVNLYTASKLLNGRQHAGLLTRRGHKIVLHNRKG